MNTRTVLIVDEEKINRNVLANILQSDYSIILASNGKEALRILKTNFKRISVIILDLEMFAMDGYELLKNIHSNPDYMNIPIIAAAQNYSDEKEEKALAYGAHDFISRPYNEKIVLHRIANTIELMETVKVVNLVIKDDLTPLHSKQYFMTKTREVFIENPTNDFDVICLDIEQFKLINDSFSIATGDKILFKLGEILKDCFDSDEIVLSRFTADIFFITLPHKSENYEILIESITNELNKYLPKIGIKLKTKICCGVYHIVDKSMPIAAMCDRAQLATENIKGQYGKIVNYYEDEIRQEMHNTLAITNMMEYTLKNNEFQVFYQPKYELASKCIAGAEALVRWQNHELGMMSPASFIPLFERNGFITQLDMFVWETVCKDLREWLDMGNEPFSISMNVSRSDIANPDLVDILVNLSDKYKINRKYLHLEIIESAYTDNPEQIIKVVTKLREKGFPIEMDDFGSGYSSLNMLAEIPIDVLKLDMGFVKNELNKANGKGILGFVISLAKWLNLAVVAEGVETPEQIRVLTSMECNYVQGFYFERPLVKSDFFKLMKKGDVREMYLTSSDVTFINRDTIRIKKARGTKVGTLLVVDDLEISRKIVSEMFHEEFDIVEAVDGLQAWNYIKENYDNISIILIDLLMPIMDGYQLIKNLRQNENTKLLPVVVTSQGNEFSEERALSIGADDFVAKPYNATVLMHRVKNAFVYSRIKKFDEENSFGKSLLGIENSLSKDSLTGLYTRKVLEISIKEFFKNSKSKEATFLIIDIDNLKTINDNYGHIKGDETIKRVSDSLLSIFRGNDVVCRMGGDEFAVFTPNKIEKNILIEKLEDLNTKLTFDVEDIQVSCSIGVCSSPEFGTDYNTLYNNSDMALLTCKRAGKNQFRIYDGKSLLPSQTFYKNMDWLLDEFSDCVMILSKDGNDVLYLNKNACELVEKEKRDCLGKKCYKILFNNDEPCKNCSKAKFNLNDFYQFENVIFGQTCLIRAREINWCGEAANIFYISKKSKIDELEK